jgi:hypothetical protein
MSQSQPNEIREAEALSLICDKWLRKGWGLRHLWIGYSGSGKTVANCKLADYLHSQGVMTICVDQKSKVSPYVGDEITAITELPSVASRRAVVRGFARNNKLSDRVDFDRLAQAVWLIAKDGKQVALICDELSDAQKGEKHFASRGQGSMPWINILYRQGREVGASIIAATQLPQEIPRVAYSLSDSVGVFRQEAHESEYYRRLHILSDADIETVAELSEFSFLLWRRGDSQRYLCRFSPLLSGMENAKP